MSRFTMFEGASFVNVAMGLGCGLVLGWIFRGRYRSSALQNVPKNGDTPSVVGETGEHKLVLVVRSDLKMGKGKIAAQCSHAAVMACKRLQAQNTALLREWEYSGQPKVVVKVDSQSALLELANKARSKGLGASVVQDAGRTQIAPGSKTVLGVGPGPVELVDAVTGHLKLL